VELTKILIDKYGPFMDLNELAELFKVQKTALYQQIYQGKLDIPHAKNGKKYLFPTHEVAAYMNNSITSSAA